MKDMEELENKTFWEITTNEGILTNFILGVSMIILSVCYLFIGVHYKIKFWFKDK